MKKAAMVLGIVGGSLAIVISLLYIVVILFALTAVSPDIGGFRQGGMPGFDRGWADNSGFFSILPLIVIIVVCFLGGGLGLAGGILAQKRNVMAGIFMCVSAVLTFMFCITFIVLLLGGIFALVRDKNTALPAVQP